MKTFRGSLCNENHVIQGPVIGAQESNGPPTNSPLVKTQHFELSKEIAPRTSVRMIVLSNVHPCIAENPMCRNDFML
jgi:hypothetical protein